MLVESLTAAGLVIDRLIQLVTKREMVDRNAYSDFVAPVMADIQAVHDDYMGSFKQYLEKLDDVTVPFNSSHPVFEAIARDRTFSKGLHTRANVLSELRDLDPRLKRFAGLVESYFQIAIEEPRHERLAGPGDVNRWVPSGRLSHGIHRQDPWTRSSRQSPGDPSPTPMDAIARSWSNVSNSGRACR